MKTIFNHEDKKMEAHNDLVLGLMLYMSQVGTTVLEIILVSRLPQLHLCRWATFQTSLLRGFEDIFKHWCKYT